MWDADLKPHIMNIIHMGCTANHRIVVRRGAHEGVYEGNGHLGLVLPF